MIESLTCGVPCFSTNVGDAKQINYDSQWVINSHSMFDLACVCHEYFELDVSERKKLSAGMVEYCKAILMVQCIQLPSIKYTVQF